MSKPEDIPQDVWEIATDAADDWFEVGDKFYRACAIHFAKAILAAKAEEQQECLSAISMFPNAYHYLDAAIRKRGDVSSDHTKNIREE